MGVYGTFIQYIHPSLFAEVPLHLLIAQWEKPRIVLWPALQHANALPTELRRTLSKSSKISKSLVTLEGLEKQNPKLVIFVVSEKSYIQTTYGSV